MDVNTPDVMAMKREAAERLGREARRREARWAAEARQQTNMPKASVPGSVRRRMAREAAKGRTP